MTHQEIVEYLRPLLWMGFGLTALLMCIENGTAIYKFFTQPAPHRPLRDDDDGDPPTLR